MKWKPVAVLASATLLGLWAGVAMMPADAQDAAAPAAAVSAGPEALVGKPAPAFELPDQNDKARALGAEKGKWVVLAFYPADMTGGCTLQNKSYSDNRAKFDPLNAVVYTVSTQDTASKREFCSKAGLENTLLSDVGGKTAAAYQVLPPNGKVARRVTFYIDPAGNIAAVDTKPRVATAAEDSLATLTRLASAEPAATKPAKPMRVALKELVPDFALTDTVSGKEMSLTGLSAGKKGAVIIFVSVQCPVSNEYNESMKSLASTYGPKGFVFIGINANSPEQPSAIAEHAKKNGFPFPVLKDTDSAIADRFNARVTPEVYVVNEQGILVYHGNITPEGKMNRRNLATVLDALADGKPVAVESMEETRAFGCAIKRAARK